MISSVMQVPEIDGITVLDDGTAAAEQQISGSDSDSDSDQSASDADMPAASDSSDDEPALPKEPKLSSKGSLRPIQQQSEPDAELQDFQNVQERREEMKQQMGVTASKLLQNPEANLPSMRSLLALAADKDSQVRCSSPDTVLSDMV